MARDTDNPNETADSGDAGPITPADATPPVAEIVLGEVIRPTVEDVQMGRIGNGAWQPASFADPAAVAAAHAESREVAKDNKRQRIEAYEEEKRKQLREIAQGEALEVKQWLRILKKLDALGPDEELSKQDERLFKTLCDRVERGKERAMGRPTTKVEAEHNHSVLHALEKLNRDWK